MIRSYIFKLLRSPYLYAAMAAALTLCLFAANARLGGRTGLNGADVCSDIEALLHFFGYCRAFVVFGAIPFAANFADEWNSKAVINCVTRKSVLNYAVSNTVICFISSLVTVFVPLIIFAALDCTVKPIFYGLSGTPAYGGFAKTGLPFLSVLFIILTYSLSCAMWAVTGMTLSAFFPSKYIALGAPFLFCNTFERITYNLPPLLNLMNLTNAWTGIPDGLTFIYTTFIFAGLSALCGILFSIKVGKRVRNNG